MFLLICVNPLIYINLFFIISPAKTHNPFLFKILLDI